MYFLLPILNLIGLEVAFLKYPKAIYVVGVCIICLTMFFVYTNARNDKVKFKPIMVSVCLFLLAHYCFFIFLEGAFLVHSFITLTSFALFVFLYCIYDKYNNVKERMQYTIENIVGYFNLMTFFFLSIAFFYFNLNTNQKFISLFTVVLCLILLLSYSSLQVFSLFSLNKKTLFYIGIVLLLVIEFLWVISLLPFFVYAQGALLTLIYYATFGISKHYLIFGIDEINKRVLWRYLRISVLGMFLVLASSWI